MNDIAQLKDQICNIIDEYFPEIDEYEINRRAEFLEIRVCRRERNYDGPDELYYGYAVIDTSDLLSTQNVLEFIKPLLADAYLQTFD